MISGTYYRGMLVIAGDPLKDAYIAVRTLGSMTGQDIVSVIPTRAEPPPPLPIVTEPEPPPRKKSWRQQQKELPKFLK